GAGEAEALYREALAGYVRLRGESSPTALLVRSNLAGAVLKQNRLDDAEQLLRRCLDDEPRVLGPDHPSHWNTMEILARILHIRGRWGEAEALQRELLDAYRRQFGPDGPRTLPPLHNLAVLRELQGDCVEAEGLLRSAVAGGRRAGDFGYKTFGALTELAHVYCDQRRWADAEPVLREAIVLGEKLLPADHLELSLNLVRLG